MSWWAWATVGVLAYAGLVVLVVRACRWSARLEAAAARTRSRLPPGARATLGMMPRAATAAAGRFRRRG